MKKSPKMSNAKLLAVFVAGLVVATAGWYLSDRLNVAFGQSADINLIGSPNNHTTPPTSTCLPGDKTHVVRELNGCVLITKSVSCLPVQKYLNTIKTRTGTETYESTIPKRFSKPITKYETSMQEKRSLIDNELSLLDAQINEVRKIKSASALTQDEKYQELKTAHAEIKEMRRKMLIKECPTGLNTQ